MEKCTSLRNLVQQERIVHCLMKQLPQTLVDIVIYHKTVSVENTINVIFDDEECISEPLECHVTHASK